MSDPEFKPCSACKHRKLVYGGGLYWASYCKWNKGMRSIVTGKTIEKHEPCSNARAGVSGHCGPSGNHFEPSAWTKFLSLLFVR